VPGLFLAKTTVWRSAVPPRHAIEALSLLAAEPRLCRRYLELPYVCRAIVQSKSDEIMSYLEKFVQLLGGPVCSAVMAASM
jgi:hypothetical protein